MSENIEMKENIVMKISLDQVGVALIQITGEDRESSDIVYQLYKVVGYDKLNELLLSSLVKIEGEFNGIKIL